MGSYHDDGGMRLLSGDDGTPFLELYADGRLIPVHGGIASSLDAAIKHYDGNLWNQNDLVIQRLLKAIRRAVHEPGTPAPRELN